MIPYTLLDFSRLSIWLIAYRQIKHCYNLDHADPKEKLLIADLRENPVQSKIEVGPKGSYEVHYNLKIPARATSTPEWNNPAGNNGKII